MSSYVQFRARSDAHVVDWCCLFGLYCREAIETACEWMTKHRQRSSKQGDHDTNRVNPNSCGHTSPQGSIRQPLCLNTRQITQQLQKTAPGRNVGNFCKHRPRTVSELSGLISVDFCAVASGSNVNEVKLDPHHGERRCYGLFPGG
jgi:hypothetical protein